MPAAAASGRDSRSNGGRSWLLIKHRDDWSGDLDITEFAPHSVKSDGDFEDILARGHAGHLAVEPAGQGRRGRRDARDDHRARREAESQDNRKGHEGSEGRKSTKPKRPLSGKSHQNSAASERSEAPAALASANARARRAGRAPRAFKESGRRRRSALAHSQSLQSSPSSRRDRTLQTAYASRRRSWRAISPVQNSPPTSSQWSGRLPGASGSLCSSA